MFNIIENLNSLLYASIFVGAFIGGAITYVITKWQKGKFSKAADKSISNFETLLKLTSDYTFEIKINPGARHTHMWATPQVEYVTGYTPKEIDKIGWIGIIHPDDREKAREAEAQWLLGLSTQQEFRIYTKSGELRWLRNQSEPIINDAGQTIGVLGATTDITELKETISALENTSNRLKQAQKISGVGYWGQDRSTLINWWSPEFAEITGLDLDSTPLSRDDFVNIVHPDDRETFAQQLITFRDTGEAFGFKVRIITPQGILKHIRGEGRTQTNQQGEIVNYSGIIQDITNELLAGVRQAALYQIAQAAIVEDSLDKLYASVHKIIRGALKVANFYIALVNQYDKTINFAFFVDEQDTQPDPHPMGKGLTEYVIRSGESLLADEGKQAELDALGKTELRGTPSPIWLGVPLKIGEETIGAMVVQDYHDATAFNKDDQKLLEFVSSQVAISIQRKLNEEALRASEENYRGLYENALAAFYRVRLTDSKIIKANKICAEIMEYDSLEHLLELGYSTDFHPLDQRLEFLKILERHGEVFNFEFDTITHKGNHISLSVNAKLFPEEGFLEGMALDITARKHAEERLIHNAHHDPLTDLPNRNYVLERLEQAVRQAQRDENYRFALMFMDLDNFKKINDSLGHAIGDELLIKVAAWFHENTRPTDVVSRFGGDEFVIFVDNVRSTSQVVHFANRINQHFTLPIQTLDQEIFTSTSIGIVIGDHEYTDAQDLLRDADIAMYKAKDKGPGSYVIFDQYMHTLAKERLDLETELRYAVERQEFEIHYEPIVDLNTDEPVGLEALLRWRHPIKGLIPPGDFIAITEEIGLLTQIGYWMIDEACRQLREWKDDFLSNPDFFISLNLSEKQFNDTELVEKIKSALRENNIEGQSLWVEIHETAVMSDLDKSLGALVKLKGLNLRLAIDDFGTGYSSLSHLRYFPVNMLKIDQSFIRELDKQNNFELVKAILSLAENLGVDVIAEGIETPEQLSSLQSINCRFGQGFYFSNTLDSAGITKHLKEKLTTS